MKTVSWTDDVSWDEVLWQAEDEEVLVLRDGRPVVLLTPFDDADLAWPAREQAPAFLASVAQARRQVERGDTISHGELKKALDLD
jgi:antitoxin (DNA-binding transcriptional repressor) of toxin-antitoxin stability system